MTTAHMDTRIIAAQARVGDLLVVANRTRYDSTIVEVRKLPVGHIVSGPRGGRYRLRVAMTALKLRSGHAPVIHEDATVTVYRQEA